MRTIDSPEFKEMIEQDNQFLAKGKIDWETKILPIAHEIKECQEQLSVPDRTWEVYLEEYPDFSLEKHKTYFRARLDRARTELTNLIASISDKGRIEALANEIKGWGERDKLFSWNDVALSILRFPETVIFDYDRCPDCGHPRVRIYFHSPKWTEAMMCSKGGEMAICPACKTQSELFGMLINS